MGWCAVQVDGWCRLLEFQGGAVQNEFDQDVSQHEVVQSVSGAKGMVRDVWAKARTPPPPAGLRPDGLRQTVGRPSVGGGPSSLGIHSAGAACRGVRS